MNLRPQKWSEVTPTLPPPLDAVPYRDTLQGQMIASFRCRETERLWMQGQARRWSAIARAAIKKLALLDAADGLDDVRVPPGNRLEALKGDRAGQHSIRINDQWRLCFRWHDGQAHDVGIVDYH